MPSTTKRRSLADEFHILAVHCRKDKLTLGELADLLAERGHALLTLMLSFPFMLPIPLPGLSIIFGLILASLGVLMAVGQKPWIPKKWRARQLSPELIGRLLATAEKIMRRIEKLIKPRGKWLTRFHGTRALNGFLIATCGILLALPLPPGTNFPPGISCALISLGILEDDGVVLGLGYVMYVINIAFFGFLALFGYDGVKALFS